jgi:hypothetical protein
MDTPTPPLDPITDLDARHEELLRRLDELDKRVEKTLAECQVYRILPPDDAANAAA